MYKLADIKPAQLPQLDRVELKATHEPPLVLSKVYAAVKEASDNFKKKNDMASQADDLMHQVLVKRGFYKSDAAEAAPQAAKSNKASLSEAIDGLKTLLEFDASNASLKEAIDGLETLLEFA